MPPTPTKNNIKLASRIYWRNYTKKLQDRSKLRPQMKFKNAQERYKCTLECILERNWKNAAMIKTKNTPDPLDRAPMQAKARSSLFSMTPKSHQRDLPMSSILAPFGTPNHPKRFPEGSQKTTTTNTPDKHQNAPQITPKWARILPKRGSKLLPDIPMGPKAEQSRIFYWFVVVIDCQRCLHRLSDYFSRPPSMF